MKTIVISLLVAMPLWTAPIAAQGKPDVEPGTLMRQILRADYEGDRPALTRLHASLGEFTAQASIRSRVHYWRGYAMWRRALNGFNERAPAAELERDLQQAIADFRAAHAADPLFADAFVGEASCLVNLSFLKMSDTNRAREWFVQSEAALANARRLDPDNPRLLWVTGANQWYASAERGGGPSVAIETYERGLRIARQRRDRKGNVLDPEWGEPELLMNLAFAHLNSSPSAPARADAYAREALLLVPYWHYLRDILLPQITKAAKGR
jgi:hypothetical protein